MHITKIKEQLDNKIIFTSSSKAQSSKEYKIYARNIQLYQVYDKIIMCSTHGKSNELHARTYITQSE